MIIRDETDSDAGEIRALTAAAFADVPQSSQSEAALVEALRAAGALTLSLVAVDDDGRVVGHVALSPVAIDGDAGRGWYGGGPLSVRPDRQHRGIGTALVRSALDHLRARNASGCVAVGDPEYYRRFGFTSGSLVLPGVPAHNVLAVAFDGAVPAGTVAFHPAFDAARPGDGTQ